jgi:predicted transcriptional regulator
MRVEEIRRILNAELLTGEDNLEIEIKSACGSDLMSDVMAYVKENVLLLTGLVNPQVIRTAEMMDIKAVVFVRGKNPGQAVTDLARDMRITVMATRDPMFIACGKLYNAGLTGRGVWD